MNVGSVVPQIFFDLIARISPGMVVILTGLYVSAGADVTEQQLARVSDWLARENSPVTLLVFLALFVAYVLAFVLDGLCGLLSRVPRLTFFKEADDTAQNERILEDFRILHPELGEGFRFPGVALRYDAVRLKDANAGARLTKLRAELHMCRVLILGLSLLAILNVLNLVRNFGWPTGITEFLLIVAVVSFMKTHNNLQDRFAWGSCNHWLLLVKPGILCAGKAPVPRETPKAGAAEAELFTPAG